MSKIQKLSQDTINKIAAGEVIERPASVVKELIDNSIDAGAKNIKIRLKDGGKKLIQIEDDGVGITKDELEIAFEAHTTSKISKIEDLNNLITMGFRGEALSTIKAVAKVTAISKTVEQKTAYQLVVASEVSGKTELINIKGSANLTPVARQTGTTIIVEDLFYNIPARLRYLRQEETEYRKIIEILENYFLINSHIGFEVYKNDKLAIKLNAIPEASTALESIVKNLSPIRIKEVVKADWTEDMLPVQYDGNGVKIEGFVAHPKYHSKKTPYQYIFINQRSIRDFGIVKSVNLGFGRFIPDDEKMPFILSIKIKPDLVDVNIHPRKEEVAFINPFRIYNAVQEAVDFTVKKNIKEYPSSESHSKIDQGLTFTGRRSSNEITFGKGNLHSVNAGLKFSEALLQDHEYKNYSMVEKEKYNKEGILFSTKLDSENDSQENINESELNAKSVPFDIHSESKKFFQIFNKYIIAEYDEKIVIFDQHAAAERITFEKLLNRKDLKEKDSQTLLIEHKVEVSNLKYQFLSENKSFFDSLGFELQFKSEKKQDGEKLFVYVKKVPTELIDADYNKLFDEVLAFIDDEVSMADQFERKRSDIVATMACHTSIRTGQFLQQGQMKFLYEQLLKCDNPYSCPHGRPIVWELTLYEFDKKFGRVE